MSNKMWGGRFAAQPDAVMAEINASIDVDRKLFRQDIAASKAHAEMLAKQGIISAQDAKKIVHGLDTILSEIAAAAIHATLRRLGAADVVSCATVMIYRTVDLPTTL